MRMFLFTHSDDIYSQTVSVVLTFAILWQNYNSNLLSSPTCASSMLLSTCSPLLCHNTNTRWWQQWWHHLHLLQKHRPHSVPSFSFRCVIVIFSVTRSSNFFSQSMIIVKVSHLLLLPGKVWYIKKCLNLHFFFCLSSHLIQTDK